MNFKTLHITNAWHPTSGGIRTFYLELLRAANQVGHEMHLVVPGEADGSEAVGAHGHIHFVRAPLAPGSTCYRILYPYTYLAPWGKVNRILRAVRPDLVEFNDKFTLNYLGGLLRIGMLPGIDFRPTVVGLSCERLTDSFRAYAADGRFAEWFCGTYLRWLYFPLADHHLAVSSFVASELAAVANGHKVERGVWIGPMGVDNACFGQAPRAEDRRELRAANGVADDTILMLYAGRLAKEKNLPLLIEALAEANRMGRGSVRLAIAGGGDELLTLRALAAERAPGGVLFLGPLARTELRRWLAACDVFVHPNPREPFGIAPLEAMAAGVPLVAPNSGGVLNYAHAGNSWLANPTPREFAEAILDAGVPSPERERRRAAAREGALQHDWSLMTERYLRLYREVAVAREPSAAGTEQPLFRSSASRGVPVRVES